MANLCLANQDSIMPDRVPDSSDAIYIDDADDDTDVNNEIIIIENDLNNKSNQSNDDDANSLEPCEGAVEELAGNSVEIPEEIFEDDEEFEANNDDGDGGEETKDDVDHFEGDIKEEKRIARFRMSNTVYLANALRRRSIRCLNKMQIMEDVREGCDANPPSSPGHAEQSKENPVETVKTEEDQSENEIIEDMVKEEISIENEDSIVIKQEPEEKKIDEEDEDIDDKQEDVISERSKSPENGTNNKRKSDTGEHSSTKRQKTHLDDHFTARDRIMTEFVEAAECNTLDQIQNISDQILAEIKALNEMAKEKEREWNQLLHMKKLKEELLIRLQRKRQVLIINESDLAEFQSENNGQQSLLKCNQKMNMLRELRAANLEKLKQRTNFLQNAYKQKPMLDVQSIIADYRQRHPETVPRRGRRIRQSQHDGRNNLASMENQTVDSDSNETGSAHNSNGTSSWIRSEEEIKSYKEILLQFAKLSQSEKYELQMQLQNSTNNKPPPPYPEVTVHPVTSTSSVAPTNSLLHGILTKGPMRQTMTNGNSGAINGGKSTFSPTLARLLTAPEKSSTNQLTSTPNILGANILNAAHLSISDIFSGTKVRNEITITPVGSQFEASTKREPIEDEPEDQSDRLIIDESHSNNNQRSKEENPSDDGEEVPQCQGCNQKVAQFVCAGCGNQWYCSRDCQVAAWDEHSEVCSG